MVTLVFCNVPLRVLEVLAVKCRQAPTTQVIEVDENRNVVTGEVEFSPGFATVPGSF